MESGELRGEDFDHSGSVDGYELAAHDAIASGGFRSGERFSNGGRSYPWTSDVLIESGAPVLALWGSLDPTSYHGVILEHLFARVDAGDRLESRFFVGLGHQLSEEPDGLVGPIDPRVVDVVVDWMRLNFPE